MKRANAKNLAIANVTIQSPKKPKKEKKMKKTENIVRVQLLKEKFAMPRNVAKVRSEMGHQITSKYLNSTTAGCAMEVLTVKRYLSTHSVNRFGKNLPLWKHFKSLEICQEFCKFSTNLEQYILQFFEKIHFLK